MQAWFEWWWNRSSQSAVPRRLPVCGHVQTLENLSHTHPQCDICGDQVQDQMGIACRDFVPSADLTWPWAFCKKSSPVDLSTNSSGVVRLLSVENLIAALSSPKLHKLQLPSQPIGVSSIPTSGENFMVWRAQTSGASVHSGTVIMHEDGVLLLEGRGVHFYGTTFIGGVVMCAGAHFSGTFQNCTFNRAALYIVHGATVTLLACNSNDCHPAITVSGGAASATIVECTLLRCPTSIIVADGGAAAVTDTRLLRTQSGAIVHGRRSRVTLDRCEVLGGTFDFPGDHAAIVSDGAASLRTCTFSRFDRAVLGLSNAQISMHEVYIHGVRRGVWAISGAWVGARECLVGVSAPAVQAGEVKRIVPAFNAGGKGTRPGAGHVWLERCTVEEAKGPVLGMLVRHGSAATATQCSFPCPEGIAIVDTPGHGGRGSAAAFLHCTGWSPSPNMCFAVAGLSCRLLIRGGKYQGGRAVCSAADGANLAVSNCELAAASSGQGSAGVGVVQGAHAWLHKCHVHHGMSCVSVIHSTLVATDTCVSDAYLLDKAPKGAASRSCPTHGMGGWMGGTGFLCGGSNVTLRRCRVLRCVLGVEARERCCAGDKPCYTITDSEFLDCAAGVEIGRDNIGEVTRCSFRGIRGDRPGSKLPPALLKATQDMFCCSRDTGIFVMSPRADVSHCEVEGFSVGIISDTREDSVVSHCNVRVTSPGALCARTYGRVALEDCEFSGAGIVGSAFDGQASFGIVVWDGSNAAIRRCTFRKLSGDNVEAHGRCAIAMVSCTMAGGSARGVAVAGGSVVALQDCDIADTETGIGFEAAVLPDTGGLLTAKRVSVRSSSMNVHVPCILDHSGKPAVGKFVDCTFRGGLTSISVSDAPCDLSFVRCDVADCGTGYLFDGPSVGKIKGGVVSRCKTGVFVGGIFRYDDEACVLCGLEGLAAVNAAFQAASPGNLGKGRCIHEGALARVTITETKLIDCRQIGMWINMHGRVTATGVVVKGARTGYVLEYMGEPNVFKDCRAVQCLIPTKASKRISALVHPNVEPLPGVKVTPE